MNKRPLAVTILTWVYIAAGVVGLAYHVTEFKIARPFENDAVLVCSVRFRAIVGGVFMLRGQMIMHSVLLVVIAFFFFRPQACFRTAKTRTHSDD